MNISCLLGNSAIYKKTFTNDSAVIKERLKVSLIAHENKYRGDVVGNVIKLKFIKHQAFDPYFEGKLLNRDGGTLINGGFKISCISVGLSIFWFLIFISFYLKWLINPSLVKNGGYLIYFIVLGTLIAINYFRIGRRKIKEIKEDLDRIIMEDHTDSDDNKYAGG